MSDADRARERDDAERWRALMNSERLSILGTGGKGATIHIGLELWGQHPQNERVKACTTDARRILTKYADDRRKVGRS